MDASHHGRVCAECETKVHDLSSMSEGEARAFLRAKKGEHLCVRYLYDAGGKLRFAGEFDARTPVVPEYRLTRRLRARLARAALITAPFLLEACGSTGLPYVRDGQADVTEDTGHVPPDARVVEDAGPDAGV